MGSEMLPKEVRFALFERHGWLCWFCGVRLDTEKWTKTRATVDHRTPTCQGGDDSEANLVASCQSCNSRKGTKTVEQFRYYILRRKPEVIAAEHVVEAANHVAGSDLEDQLIAIAEALFARVEPVVFHGEKHNIEGA